MCLRRCIGFIVEPYYRVALLECGVILYVINSFIIMIITINLKKEGGKDGNIEQNKVLLKEICIFLVVVPFWEHKNIFCC